MKNLWIIIAVLMVLAFAPSAFAQTFYQRPALKNSSTASSAATAVSATITGVANTSVKIEEIDYICSAGTATLIIKDGNTTVYNGTTAGTTLTRLVFQPIAFTITKGATATVTLGSCGTSNVGTLSVMAEQN